MTIHPEETGFTVLLDHNTKEPFKATPVYSDLNAGGTRLVQDVSWSRGRASVLTDFSPGTATIVLDNTDGRFDPDNTAGTYSSTFGRGNPIQIRSKYTIPGGTVYKLFVGYIDSIVLTYERPMAYATLECVERVAGVDSQPLVAQSLTEQLSGARIGALLDLVSFPSGGGDRGLDTGDVLMAAETYTGDVGSAIAKVVEAEQGYFFQDRDGKALFQKRTALSGASSSVTFDDSTSVGYVDLAVEYDADSLINQATVTGAVGGAAPSVDATSVTENAPAGFTTTNLAIPNEPYALNVAEVIVGRHKDAPRSIRSFVLEPQTDGANLWAHALGLDLNDVITIKYQPDQTVASVDEIVQVSVIDSIAVDVGPAVYRVQYGVHPLTTFESQSYWVLDSGALDTDTRLA